MIIRHELHEHARNLTHPHKPMIQRTSDTTYRVYAVADDRTIRDTFILHTDGRTSRTW